MDIRRANLIKAIAKTVMEAEEPVLSKIESCIEAAGVLPTVDDLIAVAKAEHLLLSGKEGYMRLVDFERETLAFVNKDSNMQVRPKYVNDKFMGWNLILVEEGFETLLEHYDDDDENISGKQLALNVLESIRKGLDAGAEYFIMPTN